MEELERLLLKAWPYLQKHHRQNKRQQPLEPNNRARGKKDNERASHALSR